MLTNFFTNFILVSLSPIKSSVTRTCPSQFEEDPIPIVGILIEFVIIFAVFE